MIKSALKEIFIMLLLCIAIILILGVIFYNYIPTNKAVPNKLAEYTTPENIQTEIDEKLTQTETQKQEISYQIDGADLELYKEAHAYTTGKLNPFSASTSIENTENTNNTDNTNNIENTSMTVDPKSTDTFYQEEGTK